MKKLEINGKILGYLPQTWNELSKKSTINLCKLIATDPDQETLELMMLMVLTNMTFTKRNFVTKDNEIHHWLYNRKTGHFLIPNYVTHWLTKQLSWLFAQNKGLTYIESKIYLNKMPYLKIFPFRKIYGPDSALYDITWYEFQALETQYSGIEEDEDALNTLAGILYRPMAKNKDKGKTTANREDYSDHNLAKYLKTGRKLNPWQKIYIKLFYEGCRTFIISKHKNAFAGHQQTTAINQTQYYTDLTTAISKNDPTKIEIIRATRLWDVLPTLEANAKEAKALKQKK